MQRSRSKSPRSIKQQLIQKTTRNQYPASQFKKYVSKKLFKIHHIYTDAQKKAFAGKAQAYLTAPPDTASFHITGILKADGIVELVGESACVLLLILGELGHDVLAKKTWTVHVKQYSGLTKEERAEVMLTK